MLLLTRDAFRQAVFARDNHRCIFCHKTAAETPEGKLDAHHIMERRLFTAHHEVGGYFIDNGATVCEHHHMQCETTELDTATVRDTAGIKRVVLPDYFYPDMEYDKWGNPLMGSTRLRGPLFYDESVQKVLARAGKLALFSRYVKHPRLAHLPWSEGKNNDDRLIETLDGLYGKEVVVTEKMDGEQTTIYSDYLHARSIDGPSHESRNWVKSFAATWQFELGEDERICGENLFARHSIVYDESNPLADFFMGFSMWRRDLCLSWDETMEYFAFLGITPVPVIWRGVFDEPAIRSLYDPSRDWTTREGYVVRLASAFTYSQFKHSVGKFVRTGHVQTAKHHWRSQRVVPNTMRKEWSDA